jgi:hypothetical protein
LPPVKATKTITAVTLSERLGLAGTGSELTVQHSAFISASAGDLPVAVAVNDAKNALNVTSPVDNPTNWKLRLAPRTGTFAGNFELFDAGRKRSVSFTGALRQPPSLDLDGLLGDGVFILPALPGDASNERVAGEVRLSVP